MEHCWSRSTSRISSSAARSSESSTVSRISSTSSSASSRNGTPRKITSGSATELPSCSAIVATTMKMPSAESMRRSRSATSAMSPISTPSTKIIPDCSGAPKRAPRSSISSGSPFSPWKMSRGVDADRLGQLGVQAQPLEVAVERHHVARLDEVQHQLDLLGVAVPGGVDRRVARRDHVAADVVEAVDRLVDGALVAGDRRGREDDRVARAAARPARWSR